MVVLAMSQMERVYEIDRLLRNRRTVTMQRLIDELRVSRATVVRDIAYLRDRLQAPVVWDRDRREYRLDGPFSLPAVYLSSAEIHALLVLHQLVQRLHPSFLDEHLGPLKDLLRRLLGKDGSDDEVLAGRIRILHAASRLTPAEHFQTVCRALLERQRLRLKHYNRNRDEETERVVSPQRLVHYKDNWYLDAWCHLREDLRSFSLDAIRDAEVVDMAAVEIPDAQLDRELGSGYGIFAGAEVRTAELRFSPVMARWVSRERWHSQQEGQFEADGSYTLKVPYAEERELVMDILRYGSDVEVLGPLKLRQRVASTLSSTLSLYRRGT
jgi:predicted DNA-binding transcriptional regulator YafY